MGSRLVTVTSRPRWAVARDAGRAVVAAVSAAFLAACSPGLGATQDAGPLETAHVGSPPAVSNSSLKRPSGTPGPFGVARVVDGDTVRVEIAGRQQAVRLLGIDTPETKDPRKPVQCFGREASQRAEQLLNGRQVWLESDPKQAAADRYGRLLAYVWLDEVTMLNDVMVREGLAHELTYDGQYKYQDRFNAGESAAREAERGLWHPSACAGGAARAR